MSSYLTELLTVHKINLLKPFFILRIYQNFTNLTYLKTSYYLCEAILRQNFPFFGVRRLLTKFWVSKLHKNNIKSKQNFNAFLSRILISVLN